MRFHATEIAGVFVIEQERRVDERGFFARMFCERELADHGLRGGICQINTGFSPLAGTLRGMHYQAAPDDEVKIVRCVRGAVFDVVVDIRPGSPTRGRWFGVELNEENGLQLYAPEGSAHGYLTLASDSEVVYSTNKPYQPSATCGLRFDDPALAISWPRDPILVSAADRSWPLLGA